MHFLCTAPHKSREFSMSFRILFMLFNYISSSVANGKWQMFHSFCVFYIYFLRKKFVFEWKILNSKMWYIFFGNVLNHVFMICFLIMENAFLCYFFLWYFITYLYIFIRYIRSDLNELSIKLVDIVWP